MAEWLGAQPDWVSYSLAAAVLLLGIFVGRATKRTVRVPVGGVIKELRRMSETIERQSGKRPSP